MRSLSVDQNGKLSIVEVSMPVWNDCQALVRTLSCGVCSGTDMKLIHRTFKNFDSYPALLGHEAVGRVVETGKNVTKYRPGDLVLLPFIYGEHNGYHSGWGGYSEYTVVGDEQAFARAGKGIETPDYDEGCYAQTIIKPQDRVNPVNAAMIITFREVLSAIRRFGMRENESVVIYGDGPVGMCFTRFAKLLGLDPVILIGKHDDKINQAKNLGADIVINHFKEDAVAVIRDKFPDGIDNIVDAVGINTLINQAMKLVKHNGKICGYGISAELNMQLDWSDAPYNWSLNFVQWPSKKEEMLAHSQIMAWINSGLLNPDDFISHVYPFEEIISAFTRIDQKQENTKKVIIKYRED